MLHSINANIFIPLTPTCDTQLEKSKSGIKMKMGASLQTTDKFLLPIAQKFKLYLHVCLISIAMECVVGLCAMATKECN